jgi:Zn-dependent protease with chaperone function
MAEPDLIDPVVEARARAQLALRNDSWSSLKLAIGATLTATGVTVAACGLLVTVKSLEGWQVKWLVMAAFFGSAALSYLVLESRRIYEKAMALEDLFRTVRQYEILLRAEYAKVSVLDEQMRTLSNENSYLRTVSLPLRVLPQDNSGAKTNDTNQGS